MTTAEQVFLGKVLSTLKNANECLPNHPGDLREKLEYIDEIIWAWEELTGEQFAAEEEEEEEEAECAIAETNEE